MDESITRRASNGPLAHLRGVVLAALAATILILTATGFSSPHTVHSHHKGMSIAERLVRLRMRAFWFAVGQRGKPYIWGATGPNGYDCSGLVWAAYRAAGVILPRTTYEMLASRMLVRIPKWHAKRGDLAFFGPGHVELYEWGQWTIGAQHSGTLVGFHKGNAFWHATMYFRVRL